MDGESDWARLSTEPLEDDKSILLVRENRYIQLPSLPLSVDYNMIVDSYDKDYEGSVSFVAYIGDLMTTFTHRTSASVVIPIIVGETAEHMSFLAADGATVEADRAFFNVENTQLEDVDMKVIDISNNNGDLEVFTDPELDESVSVLAGGLVHGQHKIGHLRGADRSGGGRSRVHSRRDLPIDRSDRGRVFD